MDTVFADAAAAHDDQVAGIDGFGSTGNAVDGLGQNADSTAVDQRLADVAGVEVFKAVAVGDTGLVAAVDNAFVDTVTQTAGMQQAFGNIFVFGEGRSEAVTPDVDEQIRTLTGAERVAVHTDDTGHGAAVGIEGGGAVMGFDLVADVDLVVEVDHTGVVAENGDQPIHFLGDLFGTLLDEGLVAGRDLHFFAVFQIFVVDVGGEDLVFAMFAPSLGEDFQFHVGRVVAEAVGFAALDGAEVVLDGFHFSQRESECAFAADFHEFVIGDIEIISMDDAALCSGDQREVHRDLSGGIFAVEDEDGLDQLIGEQLVSNRLDLFFGEVFAVEEIFGGAEYIFIFFELTAEDVADGGTGTAAHVIGHTGFEADSDQIGAFGQSGVVGGSGVGSLPTLQNGVVEQRSDFVNFFGGQIAHDGIDITAQNFFHGKSEKLGDLFFHTFAPGIAPLGQRRDLNTIIHLKTFL